MSRRERKSLSSSSSSSSESSSSIISPRVTAISCRTSATISASPPSNLYGESPSSIGLTRSSRVGGGPIIHLRFTSSSTESIKSFSASPIPEESDVGSDRAWPTGVI
ncbi:hypothetical protein L208DRAFT_1419891 [Tricholoma matsutake]|nr:hypothetical protein L208DRAFT_1419891 [Tricholoma matsutake 945]